MIRDYDCQNKKNISCFLQCFVSLFFYIFQFLIFTSLHFSFLFFFYLIISFFSPITPTFTFFCFFLIGRYFFFKSRLILLSRALYRKKSGLSYLLSTKVSPRVSDPDHFDWDPDPTKSQVGKSKIKILIPPMFNIHDIFHFYPN